jgi:hypothetical protein
MSKLETRIERLEAFMASEPAAAGSLSPGELALLIETRAPAELVEKLDQAPTEAEVTKVMAEILYEITKDQHDEQTTETD